MFTAYMEVKKHIIAWTLIGLVLFTNLRANMMYGLYAANKDLFIELFCVNIDDPDMHCDGSCMLDKMATHSHDDHSETPPLQNIFQLELNYVLTSLHFDIKPIRELIAHRFAYLNNYSFLFSNTLEYPPIVD